MAGEVKGKKSLDKPPPNAVNSSHHLRHPTTTAIGIMNMHNQDKSWVTLQLLHLSALGLAAAWLSGCTTAGYHKSESASNSLQAAAAQVQAENRSLELTMGALRDLVNEPPADLKLQYERFGNALDGLVAAAQRTDVVGKRMELKNLVYFQAWDKQLATIDYGYVHDSSLARKLEVTNRFDVVRRRFQETQAVVQPLIAYLEDIHRALDTDLTPGGLEAIKGIAQNAEANAAKVQIGLAALANQLTAAGTRMAPVVLQAAEAPPQ